jgi:hypothetical protein
MPPVQLCCRVAVLQQQQCLTAFPLSLSFNGLLSTFLFSLCYFVLLISCDAILPVAADAAAFFQCW